MNAELMRIYRLVDYMTRLEGQDPVLVLEMSQQMLSDVIYGRDPVPTVDYVKRFCDVIDGPGDAERIAADIVNGGDR